MRCDDDAIEIADGLPCLLIFSDVSDATVETTVFEVGGSENVSYDWYKLDIVTSFEMSADIGAHAAIGSYNADAEDAQRAPAR